MIPVVLFRRCRGILALALELFTFIAFTVAVVSDAGALTTTREYDLLNRLTNSTSTSAAYNHNLARQRTRRTEADGSFWTYQYDALGQVTAGTRHWADGTLVPGQQFEFTYDDIGNRLETRTGGDASGSNLRWAPIPIPIASINLPAAQCRGLRSCRGRQTRRRR